MERGEIAMIYKCPNCDAALTYKPSLHMMECDSCASFYEPEQVEWQNEGTKEEFEIRGQCGSISE